jgi:hypothetical protein
MNCYSAKILAHTIKGFRRSVAKLINAPAFMQSPRCTTHQASFRSTTSCIPFSDISSTRCLFICLPTLAYQQVLLKKME